MEMSDVQKFYISANTYYTGDYSIGVERIDKILLSIIKIHELQK